MLFGLLYGWGLLEGLFGVEECEKRSVRIRQLAKLELVGRSTTAVIKEATDVLGKAILNSGMQF